MGLSFAQYLAITKIFSLDHGRVLSLAEALDTQQHVDPQQTAQDRIAQAHKTYPTFKPKAHFPDDIAAACAGLKPAAIVQYLHHPDSPAAAIVNDEAKKTGVLDSGAVQAELLKHGFKVRPDFHIVHMNLFYGGHAQIIVGGKTPVLELEKLFRCQYYLDLISSPEHQGKMSPEQQDQVVQMARGQCHATCSTGSAGINCRPLHKEIGLLLGYPEDEVEEYIRNMTPGSDHLPDVPYPSGIMPSKLAQYTRK